VKQSIEQMHIKNDCKNREEIKTRRRRQKHRKKSESFPRLVHLLLLARIKRGESMTSLAVMTSSDCLRYFETSRALQYRKLNQDKASPLNNKLGHFRLKSFLSYLCKSVRHCDDVTGPECSIVTSLVWFS